MCVTARTNRMISVVGDVGDVVVIASEVGGAKCGAEPEREHRR